MFQLVSLFNSFLVQLKFYYWNTLLIFCKTQWTLTKTVNEILTCKIKSIKLHQSEISSLTDFTWHSKQSKKSSFINQSNNLTNNLLTTN